MGRIVAAVVGVSLFSISAAAQQDADTVSRGRILGEAGRLGNAGQVFAARRITDSLAKVTTSDAADVADVLFARATFAPSMLDASLDYEKIVSEHPRTPAAKASLLRLAQRALIASDPVRALDYLQRILRDYTDDASVAEAQYWRTRALLDSHDVTSACSANREARTHAQAAHSPLTAAIESQGLVSCGNPPLVQVPTQPKPVAATTTSPTNVAVNSGPPKAPVLSGKKYAVQVAAYATRRDAEGMAERLRQQGLDAHVDGDAKPFRVRIGRYATYADAAKALRDLKSRKISGFVSETNE
jgi:cell division protein FtsN